MLGTILVTRWDDYSLPQQYEIYKKTLDRTVQSVPSVLSTRSVKMTRRKIKGNNQGQCPSPEIESDKDPDVELAAEVITTVFCLISNSLPGFTAQASRS